MKISAKQTDECSLSEFGEEASAMLARNDYSGLASRFGYAVAYDREPATAIEADYLAAAASPHEMAPDEHFSVAVRYFEQNSIGLFAVVECIVPVAEEAAVHMDLIVTGWGEEKHITVEGITGVTW